jgi:hypothetical protein
MTGYPSKKALAQPAQQDVDRFCDANCVWTDHHPDCKLAQPEQEPVANVDLKFMRQVLSVSIAGLYEYYKDDVLRVFSVDDLQNVLDLSEPLRPQQVEDIYRRAWDMLAAHGIGENT